MAEEAGRRDKGDGRASHPGIAGCLEGPIKNPPNSLSSMDSFGKRVNEEERVFSILDDNYTLFTLKED